MFIDWVVSVKGSAGTKSEKSQDKRLYQNRNHEYYNILGEDLSVLILIVKTLQKTTNTKQH